jgi:hypothetical protein
MIIFLQACMKTSLPVKPPRPVIKSQYDLLAPGDWYLPPASALRLGEYILELERGYEE